MWGRSQKEGGAAWAFVRCSVVDKAEEIWQVWSSQRWRSANLPRRGEAWIEWLEPWGRSRAAGSRATSSPGGERRPQRRSRENHQIRTLFCKDPSPPLNLSKLFLSWLLAPLTYIYVKWRNDAVLWWNLDSGLLFTTCRNLHWETLKSSKITMYVDTSKPASFVHLLVLGNDGTYLCQIIWSGHLKKVSMLR